MSYKIEVPIFEGLLDPALFCDWLNSIESYFAKYSKGEDHRVRFAKMKFIRLAKNMVAWC